MYKFKYNYFALNVVYNKQFIYNVYGAAMLDISSS